MNFSLKESTFSEIYRILATNIDKVNYLNSSMVKSNNNYIKIKQFLSEFEYDLKLIYDILSQLQYESNNINRNEQYKSEKRKNKHYSIFNKIKKQLRLNNFEESNRNNYKDNKHKENKKYSLTINILSDKYFDTKGKGKMGKKFNKSCSCKSYKKKLSKNILKNLEKMKLRGSSYSKRNNDDNINDEKMLTYLTDYSHISSYSESYNNKFRKNIDKNKVSLKHLNTLYNHYDALLRKKNNYIPNNTNYEYSTIPTNKLDLDNNINDINNNYDYNYNTPLYKTYNRISTEENKNQENININDNNRFNEHKDIIDKNNNNDYKSNKNHCYDYIKDYERNNNYMKEEMIKKIISQILQNNNKLNELKKIFGSDIGQKLLDGVFNIKEINNIYDCIKKLDNKEEKNLFRGSKRSYRNYKYENNNNNKNDILLLRDFNRDIKYNEINNNNNINDDYYYREPLSNEY